MKNHGIVWLISRAIGLLLISATLVWGLAFYHVPFFEWMDNTQRQAAALIICALLLAGYGLIWLWAKVTNRL